MRDLEDEARIKAYMAAKMKHIKMYNECMNLADGLDVEKFAELVRADEREKVAQWMMDTGYATGHGDSIEDLLKEIEWQVAERERNACSKVVEDTLEPWLINEYIVKTTEAIRARGNDLQTAIERGTKAWADVPADWVEELRGNDTPGEKNHD